MPEIKLGEMVSAEVVELPGDDAVLVIHARPDKTLTREAFDVLTNELRENGLTIWLTQEEDAASV